MAYTAGDAHTRLNSRFTAANTKATSLIAQLQKINDGINEVVRDTAKELVTESTLNDKYTEYNTWTPPTTASPTVLAAFAAGNKREAFLEFIPPEEALDLRIHCRCRMANES